MSLFCCRNAASSNDSTIEPEPIKIKILKLLKIWNPIMSIIVLPKKKEIYNFPRDNLKFLSYPNTHTPILLFTSPQPVNEDILIVYCHGSGSNLNNLYNFGSHISSRFKVSVLLYDYTGDGESKRDFYSYEMDLKVVLAWAQHIGYPLHRIVLCGYSIGSFSALLLKGEMARILISPICGLIPFVEGTSNQYEGETFDNLENAENIKSRVLIAHGAKEMIPYEHAEAIASICRRSSDPKLVDLYKVEGFDHLSMPNFLLNNSAKVIMNNFLTNVKNDSKQKQRTIETLNLKDELKKIAIKTQVSMYSAISE